MSYAAKFTNRLVVFFTSVIVCALYSYSKYREIDH